MKKTIKDLFKLITAIATVAGILYVARDQIKAIIAKIKEVSDDDFDDDFDDDEIFPEPSKDDRDYVSINITDTDDDDPSVVEEESQETETPSEESDEKE